MAHEGDSYSCPLEFVLSVTTGVLLTDIGNVCKILNFLTGDDLFTHQLPRAAEVCGPWILEQHPELAAVNTSIEKANTGEKDDWWKPFLKAQKKKYGATLTVKQLPAERWQHKDPIVELTEKMGSSR